MEHQHNQATRPRSAYAPPVPSSPFMPAAVASVAVPSPASTPSPPPPPPAATPSPRPTGGLIQFVLPTKPAGPALPPKLRPGPSAAAAAAAAAAAIVAPDPEPEIEISPPQTEPPSPTRARGRIQFHRKTSVTAATTGDTPLPPAPVSLPSSPATVVSGSVAMTSPSRQRSNAGASAAWATSPSSTSGTEAPAGIAPLPVGAAATPSPATTLRSARARSASRARAALEFGLVDDRPAFDASYTLAPPVSAARLEREARGAALLAAQQAEGFHFSRREVTPPTARARSQTRLSLSATATSSGSSSARGEPSSELSSTRIGLGSLSGTMPQAMSGRRASSVSRLRARGAAMEEAALASTFSSGDPQLEAELEEARIKQAEQARKLAAARIKAAKEKALATPAPAPAPVQARRQSVPRQARPTSAVLADEAETDGTAVAAPVMSSGRSRSSVEGGSRSARTKELERPASRPRSSSISRLRLPGSSALSATLSGPIPAPAHAENARRSSICSTKVVSTTSPTARPRTASVMVAPSTRPATATAAVSQPPAIAEGLAAATAVLRNKAKREAAAAQAAATNHHVEADAPVEATTDGADAPPLPAEPSTAADSGIIADFISRSQTNSRATSPLLGATSSVEEEVFETEASPVTPVPMVVPVVSKRTPKSKPAAVVTVPVASPSTISTTTSTTAAPSPPSSPPVMMSRKAREALAALHAAAESPAVIEAVVAPIETVVEPASEPVAVEQEPEPQQPEPEMIMSPIASSPPCTFPVALEPPVEPEQPQAEPEHVQEPEQPIDLTSAFIAAAAAAPAEPVTVVEAEPEPEVAAPPAVVAPPSPHPQLSNCPPMAAEPLLEPVAVVERLQHVPQLSNCPPIAAVPLLTPILAEPEPTLVAAPSATTTPAPSASPQTSASPSSPFEAEPHVVPALPAPASAIEEVILAAPIVVFPAVTTPVPVIVTAASLHTGAKPKFCGEWELIELACGLVSSPAVDHLVYSVSEASRSDRAHALGKVRLHQKLNLVHAGSGVLTDAWRDQWLKDEQAWLVLMRIPPAESTSSTGRLVLVEWVGSSCPSESSLPLQELSSQVDRALRKYVPLALSTQASHPAQVALEAFAEDLGDDAAGDDQEDE